MFPSWSVSFDDNVDLLSSYILYTKSKEVYHLNTNAIDQRVGVPQGAMGWQGPPQSPGSYIVKKILRLEVPTETYPNVCFHFFVLAKVGTAV
jgi:hypothetical protein